MRRKKATALSRDLLISKKAYLANLAKRAFASGERL